MVSGSFETKKLTPKKQPIAAAIKGGVSSFQSANIIALGNN